MVFYWAVLADNVLFDYSHQCDDGYLFNVSEGGDMSEHAELSGTHPEQLASMHVRLATLTKTVWDGKSVAKYNASCQAAVAV